MSTLINKTFKNDLEGKEYNIKSSELKFHFRNISIQHYLEFTHLVASLKCFTTQVQTVPHFQYFVYHNTFGKIKENKGEKI